MIKFGNTEIEKQNFYQQKSFILVKNIDIDKIVVSNKVSFGKKGFKCFIGYKDGKKFDFYAYFSQKCVYKEETLMKLNTCLFLKKR